MGFRRHRSHRLQLVDRCLIAAPKLEELHVEQLTWPGAAELEVLTSPDDDQRVVTVTTQRRHPGALPPLDAGMVVDGRTQRKPSRVHFEVLGRTYQVTAGSFWQVHPAAATVLAGTVLDELAPAAGEHVIDLYAGVGLFTALIADRVGSSGTVVAVERGARACADAKRNTVDQPQVEIVRAPVTPALIAQSGTPDLVVLDPTREGAGRPVMTALTELPRAPRRIVYVSCDPASFARDLRVMLDAGWTMPSLRAFDLFPMTEHVELIGVLEPEPARGADRGARA